MASSAVGKEWTSHRSWSIGLPLVFLARIVKKLGFDGAFISPSSVTDQ